MQKCTYGRARERERERERARARRSTKKVVFLHIPNFSYFHLLFITLTSVSPSFRYLEAFLVSFYLKVFYQNVPLALYYYQLLLQVLQVLMLVFFFFLLSFFFTSATVRIIYFYYLFFHCRPTHKLCLPGDRRNYKNCWKARVTTRDLRERKRNLWVGRRWKNR